MRFTVDVEHEAVADPRLQAKGREVDRQRHAERCSGAQPGGATCFEPSVHADRFFTNHDGLAVFVDQVEFPYVADICAVPRHGDMDGERQRLRLGADHRQATAQHEQLAVTRLGGIAEQHVHTEPGGHDKIFHTSTIRASTRHTANHTPHWRAVTAPEIDEQPDETPVPGEGTLAVILAAGAGSRFNAPEHKLESKLKKKPLVWWAATHALAAGFSEVLVIEGSIPVSALVPSEVSIVHNHDWADGQSRSLQVAVAYADLAGYDTLVIGLADQPFVQPEAWRLVAASTSPIAVARFDKQATPPVRLHSDVWGLLPLDGDEGARQLLRSRPELVTEVPCPGSAVDVDTVVEFDQVRRNQFTRELGSWT